MSRRPAEDRDATWQRIYATVDSIPPGRVGTYGQVALEAGLPRRARLVGHCLKKLPASSALPWFRVLGAGGKISLLGAARKRQMTRLRAEGVKVNAAGRVSLAKFGWQPDD